jgi:hypothetical protein
MTRFLIAALTALALATAANAAPQCKTGVPCGNTCIAKGKVCHVTPPAPPKCVKGKLCGSTCIKATDVCHKP